MKVTTDINLGQTWKQEDTFSGRIGIDSPTLRQGTQSADPHSLLFGRRQNKRTRIWNWLDTRDYWRGLERIQRYLHVSCHKTSDVTNTHLTSNKETLVHNSLEAISWNQTNFSKPSGLYTYCTTRFNIKKFYMVLALLWVFCTDLRTDSKFCFIHH